MLYEIAKFVFMGSMSLMGLIAVCLFAALVHQLKIDKSLNATPDPSLGFKRLAA